MDQQIILNLSRYFYYKNLFIFVIDTGKMLRNLSKYKNFAEIRVISEILYLVIIRKLVDYAKYLREVVYYNKNEFNIPNFQSFQ